MTLGSWPRRLRERLGERGLGVLVLVVLLALAVVPLVAMPAARCKAFGGGCPRPEPPVRADPVMAKESRVTPAQAATRGAYVALGDSYSAGLGAEATVGDRKPLDRCRRTSKAYYHEVSQTFHFAKGSSFWACSGAKTADVLKGRYGEPPQIDHLNGGTSLVTLSIGGNDVGFSKVLGGCVVHLPWSHSCTEQGEDIASRMAKLREDLPALLEKITERAPNARVIVMGYPKAFSEVQGIGGDNITVSDQRWLNARAYELGRLVQQSVAEVDRRLASRHGRGSVEFVDAYSAFAGHEVGSSAPYINGLALNLSALQAEPRSFHPTVAGQHALAQLFIAQINKGPGRPLS
ncbi:SGNH/GDSL hydrolase family protein [Actinomadura opuntiae]|uniref:SGNH/GDSL hydrolase family protein n=1 Tax=Actinomadura sp. OS1-43 TaxID=604315 RepID=UPI00255AAABB|nr:SGNH/GDSL hydrolase family protein [Actinomadura sp. OS1-43]MDL4820587.1 SGNH/GDSL hydrolase family protein [Actinomadura sp. OS1-43]